MSTSLYRKYRPKSLSEVAGQEHITKTLEKALKKGQISHAYLFTGPRGVGKTSVARILAHDINNLKYIDDSQDIDIIEIDAASNRRIDEIRELREMAYMAPVGAKYKVYIIDEVHMLTKEAFNALLKILEEPPAHVIFILATTESHKLPETIISRTQRYSFKSLTNEDVEKHLKLIAGKEKISIDKEAVQIIAEHSGGSLRDALSLLDQASSLSSSITEENIINLLGIASKAAIVEIINLLLVNPDINKLAKSLNNLYEQGFQASLLAKDISRNLRDLLINNTYPELNYKILDILKDLIDVPISFNPERYLEVTLMKYSLEANSKVNEAAVEKKQVIDHTKKEVIKENIKEVEPIKNSNEKVENKELTIELWPEILSNLKKKHNTLYGVVRMASPEIVDNKLILNFKFEFHLKRINEAANFKMLSDTVRELTGIQVKIECVQSDKTTKELPIIKEVIIEDEAESKELNDISSIFNGAELLES